MQNTTLKKYSICIVSKEYRWIEVFAGDEAEAKDKVWDEIACGFVGDNKPEDTDTDLYVEGVVDDEE